MENQEKITPKALKKKKLFLLFFIFAGIFILCLIFGLILNGLESLGVIPTRTPSVEIIPLPTQLDTQTESSGDNFALDLSHLVSLSPDDAVDLIIEKYGEPQSYMEQSNQDEIELSWTLYDSRTHVSIIYSKDSESSITEYLYIVTGAKEDDHTLESLLDIFNVDPKSNDYYVLLNPGDLELAYQIWLSPDYIDYFDN